MESAFLSSSLIRVLLLAHICLQTSTLGSKIMSDESVPLLQDALSVSTTKLCGAIFQLHCMNCWSTASQKSKVHAGLRLPNVSSLQFCKPFSIIMHYRNCSKGHWVTEALRVEGPWEACKPTFNFKQCQHWIQTKLLRDLSDWVWRPPRMEALQPLWAACCTAWLFSLWTFFPLIFYAVAPWQFITVVSHSHAVHHFCEEPGSIFLITSP